MEDNTITLTLKDGKVKVEQEKPLDLSVYLQIMLTGILTAMNQIVAQAPEEEEQTVKEELYDMLNHGASNVLSTFAPDLELRPNLTERAILKAEDEIIENGEADDFKNPNPPLPITKHKHKH